MPPRRVARASFVAHVNGEIVGSFRDCQSIPLVHRVGLIGGASQFAAVRAVAEVVAEWRRVERVRHEPAKAGAGLGFRHRSRVYGKADILKSQRLNEV